MAKVVNLTPHAIVYQAPSGERTVFEPSGTVARVDSTLGSENTADFEGVEVKAVSAPTFRGVYLETETSEGGKETSEFPEPVEGVVYLVSGFVLQHVSGRADVYQPGTGPKDGVIRFPAEHKLAGNIEAVTRFICAG